MISVQIRPVQCALRIASWLAVACVPHLGAAQTYDDPFERLTAKIVEAQEAGGTYAAELIDPLTHLSLLYEESGDYALEAAALERVVQVVRANFGLYSLEQSRYIQQQIRGEESRGNLAKAWELEQELLMLAHRNINDVRSAPILREIGDKRMDLRRRYLAGERPPQLYLGCYYGGPERPGDSRNCSSGSLGRAARTMLLEAQGHYASAMVPLRAQQLTASAELEEIEDRLYRGSYLLRDYEAGRRSLVRRISDAAANAEPPLQRIDRLVELADWDLLTRKWSRAFDSYAEIYAFLDSQGARAKISEIFSPGTPVVLPRFLSNQFAPERAEGATGYVDVEFEIGEFGTRRVRILDAHNASRAAQRRIELWVAENEFRPMTTNGSFDERARVVARHYVHE